METQRLKAWFEDSFLQSMCSSCGPEGPLTPGISGGERSPEEPRLPTLAFSSLVFTMGSFIFVGNNRCNQHVSSPLDINHKFFPEEYLMLCKSKDGKSRQVLTAAGSQDAPSPRAQASASPASCGMCHGECTVTCWKHESQEVPHRSLWCRGML